MINPTAYYTVQGWMISDLGLKGNALAVYAIIYGFSQDGASEYSGSARYLCEWLGCSRSTIMEVLKKLTERGLLIKRDIYKNGITYCTYMTAPRGCPKTGQGVQEPDRGVSENRTGGVQIPDRGCANPGHNNTRDNNRDITRKKDIESAPAEPPAPPAPPAEEEKKPPKHKHGQYKHVLLSEKEYKKLEADYGSDMVIAAVKYLDEYIEEKGYKSKNHNLAIRRWVIDAVKERQQKKAQGYRPARNGQPAGPVGPNGIAIDPTKTDLDALF